MVASCRLLSPCTVDAVDPDDEEVRPAYASAFGRWEQMSSLASVRLAEVLHRLAEAAVQVMAVAAATTPARV
jgi:hypothetical protein